MVNIPIGISVEHIETNIFRPIITLVINRIFAPKLSNNLRRKETSTERVIGVYSQLRRCSNELDWIYRVHAVVKQKPWALKKRISKPIWERSPSRKHFQLVHFRVFKSCYYRHSADSVSTPITTRRADATISPAFRYLLAVWNCFILRSRPWV